MQKKNSILFSFHIRCTKKWMIPKMQHISCISLSTKSLDHKILLIFLERKLKHILVLADKWFQLLACLKLCNTSSHPLFVENWPIFSNSVFVMPASFDWIWVPCKLFYQVGWEKVQAKLYVANYLICKCNSLLLSLIMFS